MLIQVHIETEEDIQDRDFNVVDGDDLDEALTDMDSWLHVLLVASCPAQKDEEEISS